MVVRNSTPDVVGFRDSKDGTYVFHLKAESFSRGEFTYKFVAEGKKAGTFGVDGYAIPFVAPVSAQEFPLTQSAKGK